MIQKLKEVIDWVLVLVFLGWGISFMQQGHYFSTLLLWIGAVLLLPFLDTHFRKRYGFHFYEQFKWPLVVVLLSFLILYSQMVPAPVSPEIIVIEREIFAPEVQLPAEVEEEEGIVYVQIVEGGYSPDNVAIVPGTTVVWNNTWSVHVLHIYQLNGKYRNIAQSEKLAEGDLFSHTFEKKGVYTFRDLYFGWKGKVHVT